MDLQALPMVWWIVMLAGGYGFASPSSPALPVLSDLWK